MYGDMVQLVAGTKRLQSDVRSVLHMVDCVAACLVLPPNDVLRLHAHAFEVSQRDKDEHDFNFNGDNECGQGYNLSEASKDTVNEEADDKKCLIRLIRETNREMDELKHLIDIVHRKYRSVFDVIVNPAFYNRRAV